MIRIYIPRYKKIQGLIKGCDLQLYEGVAFLPNSKSQTEEDSFEY